MHIKHIKNYPKNGEHIELSLPGIPFRVAKGLDRFWYYDKNDEDIGSKPHLWYALPYEEVDFRIAAFKTPEKALKYAVKETNRYLEDMIDSIHELLDEEITPMCECSNKK